MPRPGVPARGPGEIFQAVPKSPQEPVRTGFRRASSSDVGCTWSTPVGPENARPPLGVIPVYPVSQGVKFWDGVETTAADVAFSMGTCRNSVPYQDFECAGVSNIRAA